MSNRLESITFNPEVMKDNEYDIFIFTDGGCNKEGEGGTGVVIVQDNEVLHEANTIHSGVTNNIMELSAAILGLELVNEHDISENNVILVTDSNYVVTGSIEWIHNWKKNNWKTSNRRPVKNKDIWERMDKLLTCTNNLSLMWTRGHNGFLYNEMADKLASLYNNK